MPPTPEEQKILDRIPWKNMVKEHSYAGIAVFYDEYPVTEGHMLFVPLKNDSHHIGYCFKRAYRIGDELVKSRYCDSFNIGYNHSEEAGQSVNWPHIHLIPRRKGDCKDPKGGVRGVIPSKQKYKLKKEHQKTNV